MPLRNQKQRLATLPLGSVSINRLSADQVVALDRLARKWGCKTLAEAAEEILRDALEEAHAV